MVICFFFVFISFDLHTQTRNQAHWQPPCLIQWQNCPNSLNIRTQKQNPTQTQSWSNWTISLIEFYWPVTMMSPCYAPQPVSAAVAAESAGTWHAPWRKTAAATPATCRHTINSVMTSSRAGACTSVWARVYVWCADRFNLCCCCCWPMCSYYRHLLAVGWSTVTYVTAAGWIVLPRSSPVIQVLLSSTKTLTIYTVTGTSLTKQFYCDWLLITDACSNGSEVCVARTVSTSPKRA